MWALLIGVALLVLKMLDVSPVVGWSWWIIAIPFAVAVVWWAWADKMGYTQRSAMRKLDERKEARRLKSMEALGMDTSKLKGKTGRK